MKSLFVWIFCALLLPAYALAATDVSGTWTGSVQMRTPDGDTDSGTAYLKLQQSGEQITGVAGQSDEHAFAIEKGRIDGDAVAIQVTLPGENGPRVFRLKMTVVSPDTMQGEVEGVTDEGAPLKGKIQVRRGKAEG